MKGAERWEQVHALRATGLTWKQIGSQLGISYQRVQQIAASPQPTTAREPVQRAPRGTMLPQPR